jgi:uncharacterized protein (TIGR00725 family)
MISPRLARRTVAVIGSGHDPQPELAHPLGALLARLGVNLLTGGGGGVMEAVARAYVRAEPPLGISIGVLPASAQDPARPPAGYPNAYVQLPIYTHLPDRGEQGELATSRNHINVLSADAIVALPGSAGTLTELALAARYGKPVVRFTGALEEVEAFLRQVL